MKSNNFGSTKLYHSEVYMPEQFKRPLFEGELMYTQHARDEAQKDRYGHISLPTHFQAAGATLIEVETEKGAPIKQLWRQKLDEARDLVMAITKDGFVKTVWVNERNDAHKTLRRDVYEKPKRKH